MEDIILSYNVYYLNLFYLYLYIYFIFYMEL